LLGGILNKRGVPLDTKVAGTDELERKKKRKTQPNKKKNTLGQQREVPNKKELALKPL